MNKIYIERLKVDESRWPTWATHYSTASNNFLKIGDDGQWWRSDGYGLVIQNVAPKAYILRPHKTEWTDWLPPVGVECEFIHPGITSEGWQVGTIKAYFDDRVAIKSNPSIWPASGYAVILIDEELKFRPLKSQQERQREELMQWFMDNRWNGVYAAVDDILSRYNLEKK